MKVTHILCSNIFSGAEHVACEIVDMFRNEINMDYVAPSGINIEMLKMKNIEYKRIDKVSIKEIRRIVKQYNPDIIHAHDFRTSVICAFSFLKIPIVSHLHNNSPWLKTINLYSIIFLLASTRLDNIIGVSKSILDEYIFRNAIRKKFIVMSNPVDSKKNAEKSTEFEVYEKFDLIFLGRLSNEKGPLRFISIVDKLIKRIPNLKVVIIGDGKLKTECLAEINNRKLNNNVKLLGFKNNPHPYISKSKVMIMPSIWEGFGLAAVEAFSHGLPVLASNVGGLVDIVDSSCGELCNNEDQFVNESFKLLSDKEYYRMKSHNAKIKAGILDNKKIYKEKLLHIYNVL